MWFELSSWKHYHLSKIEFDVCKYFEFGPVLALYHTIPTFNDHNEGGV